MKRPFLKAGYTGIALVIISVALVMVNPSKANRLPDGFITPVIAFEFIQNSAEVYELFGKEHASSQGETVSRMEAGTYIDFLYIAVYTSFLVYFAFICSRITGRKWFYFSIIIASVVFLADAAENFQMLSIMANLQSGEFEVELVRLHYFTWAKWGGLNAVFISLILFLRRSGWFGRIISVASLLSALTGYAAYTHRSVINEIYVLSIAVVFLMLFIFSFVYRESGR